MNRRLFLLTLASSIALSGAARASSLTVHYHRYEGTEWDCYLQHGEARWVLGGKTLRRVTLTPAQQKSLHKALANSRFFSMPPRLYAERVDDRDILTVTLDGKTHTVTANRAGGNATKAFYTLLDAFTRMTGEPMDEIRKLDGNR
jgi:hypothetical protein